MNDIHWYVAHTKPRHEKKVVQHLQWNSIETLLPLYCVPRRWNNGVRVSVELPLFPGYVFFRAGIDQRANILGISSVVNIVTCNRCPVPVPESEMHALMRAASTLTAEPHPFMKEGDRVRLRSGPLKGLEGILLQRKQSYRFVLSIDLIMRSISVEVDPADIDESFFPSSRHSVERSCQQDQWTPHSESEVTRITNMVPSSAAVQPREVGSVRTSAVVSLP